MIQVLNVKNLKTYFYIEEGFIRAVDDVSFSLEKGETLGIAGESGSGKSVTALSILRLIHWPPGKIVNGRIYYRDRDILKVSNKEMRNIRGNNISMIFQDPMTSLNPVFTVGNQIIESIILHQKLNKRDAKEKAINLLKDVGIPNPENRYNQHPYEYSGGMQQRAMIAMALACNPDILIADEPTTALDVTIQAQIIELINELKVKNNSTVIIISHDLGVIAEMADSIIIMYAGKIVEYGKSKDIFYNPCHPYTLGLMNSIPKLDKRQDWLIPIGLNPPSLLNPPTGCRFHPRCKYSKKICSESVPELKSINGDNKHFSACHFSNF